MESLISHSLACYNKRKNLLPMNLKEQQQHILSGAMYNDLTPELVKAREKTVFLTNCYNASFGQPAKDIPANVVSTGVPCHVIRLITDQDKINYQP